MSALYVSQAVLWVVVACLALVVFALARQIGVLHERLTPVGALNTGTGPVVGEPAPLLRATAMDGTLLEIGTRRPSGRRLLMLFVSRGCPICKVLIPVAQDMARLETLDLLFIGDSNAPEQTALIADFQISPADFINGSTIGMTYQVDKLPHAVLIDENGLLISRGLVNSREHLESLVVAQETGFASVQDFLRRRQHA